MRRQRALSALVAGTVSVAGWRGNLLTPFGAVAATGVGTAIIHGAGWRGATLLGAFFGSSNALGRLAEPPGTIAISAARNERQVVANGGVAALCALAVPAAGARALTACAGALAAATADTWATEVGSRSRVTPRLLLSRASVERGVSGGVTPAGLAAAVAGASYIATLSALIGARRSTLAVAIAGVAGALLDSLLGETLQERRSCPVCDRPTEASVHHCGAATVHVGGVRGIDNDAVNLACALTGAGVACLGSACSTWRVKRAARTNPPADGS